MDVLSFLSTKASAELLHAQETQDVPDVHARPELSHSSSTNSEIVVPVKNANGEVVAVLDVDSDDYAAFSPRDIALTERVCEWLGMTYH